MSVSEFIQENINLTLPDLLVKYHHVREIKMPYDVDIWLKANELSQSEFSEWLFKQRARK